MAQVFMGIFMMLYYIIFIQIIVKLMSSLVKGFTTPKFKGKVNIKQGNCMDHVTVDAEVRGLTDRGYYAVINWSDHEALVTTDGDVIHSNGVIVKQFTGHIHHEFDVYPECYPACAEGKYKFTVELGWCSDEKCEERHKVMVKDAVINCEGGVGGGGGRYFTPRPY